MIEVFLPKAILMENVPGLRLKAVFREFVRAIKAFGYVPNFDVHDVSKFGVPQRRKRLVIVAGRGFPIEFPSIVEGVKTVREVIGLLPKAGQSGDQLHDYPEHRTPLMLERIRATPKDGGSRSSWPDHLWLKCHRKTNGFKDVYGRMKWDAVAPTITGGCFNPSRGRFLHPEEDRGITLREAALLQSFPEIYKFAESATKQEVALMIGNAVPPEFVRRQGLEILKAIKFAKAEGLLTGKW